MLSLVFAATRRTMLFEISGAGLNSGSGTTNVVPCPSRLSKLILPWCSSTTGFHNDQSKTAARHITHVAPAVKCLKELARVRFGNPDAVITHGEHGQIASSLDGQFDGRAGRRVFHSVVQQIGENVTEQRLITSRLSEVWRDVQVDGTAFVCGRSDLVHQPLAERDEIQRRGPIGHLPRLDAD
jgi:hypothetical protein